MSFSFLINSENVTWTVPAPTWARRKAKEWQHVASNGDVDKQEKLAAIEAQLPTLVQYRFTFQSVTIAEELARDEFLKSVRDGFEKEYGLTPPEFSRWFVTKYIQEVDPGIDYPKGESFSQYEASSIWMQVRDMADWATFMSCLNLVEERQVPMVNAKQEPPWVKIVTPEAWLDYDKFIAAIPRKLLVSCIEICNDLNPGVWEFQVDEDSKNFGGVNESR